MKKAFTMLELIFVIIIIGILAAMILPSTRTNPLQEAAVQLASHIRYTQHLAIVDDRYDRTNLDGAGVAKWYKERWQLVFTNSARPNSTVAYTIFSDASAAASAGSPDISEVALNPQDNSKILSGGTTAVGFTSNHAQVTKKLNLELSYGVTSVTMGGGCPAAGLRLAFDSLGRPLKGDHDSMKSPYNTSNPYKTGKQRLIMTPCTITLSDGADTEVLRIMQETGFVCILDATRKRCI